MVTYGSYLDESAKERDARIAAEEAADRATYAAVTDPRVVAVLDVIAPVRADLGCRIPASEYGHETTPTPAEVVELAADIVEAIARLG